MALFNMNPYLDEEDEDWPGGTFRKPSYEKGPNFPPLSPQEEEGVLGTIGRGVLGGVGLVGGILDKTFGGRAIRGLLGGKPRELLSIIPGSDWVWGLTNEKDVVYGRDLLEKAGIVGQNKEGLDWGDVAGFGMDVLLDPSLYLTGPGAALTRGGKIARMAHQLPSGIRTRMTDTLGNVMARATPSRRALLENAAKGVLGTTTIPAEVLNESLGGLTRFHLPWTQGRVLGGTGAYDFLAGAGNRVGNLPGVHGMMEAAKPIGHGMKALFNPAFEGSANPVLQPHLKRMNEEVLPVKYAEVRGATHEMAERLAKGKQYNPGQLKEIRNALEAQPQAALSPEAASVAQDIGYALKAEQPVIESLGGSVENLENYFPRHEVPLDKLPPGFRKPTNPTYAREPGMVGREHSLYRDLPTELIDQMVMNKAISSAQRTLQSSDLSQEASYILQTVLDPWERFRTSPTSMGGLGRKPVEGAVYRKQALDLADWLAQRPARHAFDANPVGFFNPNALTDFMGREMQHVRQEARLNMLHDILRENAVTTFGEDMKPLTEAIKDMQQSHSIVPSKFQEVLAERMGLPGGARDLANYYVPTKVYDALVNPVQRLVWPEALRPMLNVYDAFTNLFKGMSTVIWPTFHIRNYIQQKFGQLVGGHTHPEAALFGFHQGAKDAYSLLRKGEILQDANKIPGLEHLSAEEASNVLRREMFAWGASGPSKLTRDADLVGLGSPYLQQMELRAPGSPEPGWWDLIKQYFSFGKDSRQPWGFAGIGGRTKTTFAPAKAGTEINALVDDITRGSSWLNLRRQGFSPQAASAEVNRIHYNYGNLSGFEKDVMRRLMPFYSWTRQNLPAQLKLLADYPGGLTAQAIRASNEMHQSEGFQPPYIAETLAIPMGETGKGNRRYLTSLGLPFEDLKDFGGGLGLSRNLGRFLEKMLGQTNPLVKGPLELATGKQFFTGRDLTELYGPFGDIGLSQLVMNSPISRFYTAGRTLADERKDALAKAMNLLSGMKVTDVDIEKAKDYAARNVVSELLRGTPEVRFMERPYVAEEKIPYLDPAQVALLRMQSSIEKRVRERKKEEKSRR